MKTYTTNCLRERLFTALASAALLIASSIYAQNVGIGVSNPQSKLTVNGSTASGGIAVGNSTYNAVAPVNGAIIEGDVGIGRTAPITALDVNGTASISSGAFPSVNRLVIGWDVLQPGLGVAEFVNYFGTGGGDAFRFHFLSTGAPTTANLLASIDRAGAYHAVSDQRVKTDAQLLRYGLKEVMAQCNPDHKESNEVAVRGQTFALCSRFFCGDFSNPVDSNVTGAIIFGVRFRDFGLQSA
jgi:hypothetical protein